ncbi:MULTISPECIES: FtsK/SpoIIIE domain-containing protein [Streptomyces]|uniref:Putative plasmid transfer protein n=1 Tax=Streptomyces venezuelae (strain ATCC 10712 / CBS 650.69 / DSM 40230 / JCM 4526 / NBRC 13096 / PD 04745) TaxID=953739 RepID=F2RFY7_STRVP|nr:FtsK/SpoIIIE domain-containing protein [Streptomyces venezuelae]APE23021.1 plasmid transfer protein [Streptomyces venezuelae]QES00403.1 plasmid transfer protein [Streptomyces venezuelae ATCC 10712]CCA57289.1 putative plasmid transfer protein [Streptomyces venezuelae ATCC 10712]
MTDVSTLWEVGLPLVGTAGGLGYAKVRAPRVFWSLAGLPVTTVRFAVNYRTTMDVCGLTVQPSRLRAFMVRNIARRPDVQPVPPMVRRVRGTSTGLRVTLRLPAGLEPADVAAASERLRHAWGVHSVNVVETKPGFVELRMTGYDVLKKVRMPRQQLSGPMVVPVALREDGTAFVRDYLKVPHALTLGANQSGKSMYQRNLVAGLARLPVALVGIDCKRGVEHRGYAPRLSALAITPEEADGLLDGLVGEMEERFDLLADHGVADIWALPEYLRPVPVVVLVDEVAELFLVATKKDEERRDRMVTQLIRLGQLARAAGIYLEVCGQRFGSDLGKGATALRAQLTGRTVHRVNDKQTAEMGVGDIAPDAVATVLALPPDRPGIAVAGDTSGGWSRIRTPELTAAEAAAICTAHAHLTPDLPGLAAYRPAIPAGAAPASVPLVNPSPATA